MKKILFIVMYIVVFTGVQSASENNYKVSSIAGNMLKGDAVVRQHIKILNISSESKAEVSYVLAVTVLNKNGRD
ncbi:MAG: hypothetical protein HYV28_01765 [Ignavibacteriales bacterium]|nr:hypothetical protein [Ignavibacteriales bacterium]